MHALHIIPAACDWHYKPLFIAASSPSKFGITESAFDGIESSNRKQYAKHGQYRPVCAPCISGVSWASGPLCAYIGLDYADDIISAYEINHYQYTPMTHSCFSHLKAATTTPTFIFFNSTKMVPREWYNVESRQIRSTVCRYRCSQYCCERLMKYSNMWKLLALRFQQMLIN